MKKLRVGVIGLGMGRWHVRGFREHPGCEVVAIADTNQNRLASAGEEFGLSRTYPDGEVMLAKESLDIVSIATPNKFHHGLTVRAFRAGCHVLCEKPMAMNASEAREMLAAAKRARKRLMINFSYRFSAASQALKREVDRGALGKVYFGRTVWHRKRGVPGFGGWFTNKALAGGGPLIDLGVHRLDLALWLMGHPRPQWAMAGTYDHLARAMSRGNRKLYSVEDLAAGFIRFRNGATLVVEASWAANIAEAELMETRLMGTKGGLVQRNLNGSYEFEAELFTERKGKVVASRVESAGIRARSPMHHFVDCLVRGRPHSATGEEGLVVMEILDALYASAKTGRPVRI